jgi:hypothetical protein
MARDGIDTAAVSGRLDGPESYQLGLLSSGPMAPGTRDDITTKIDTVGTDTGTTGVDVDSHAEDDAVPPWHERPVVLIAGAIAGVIGLVALAVSVIAMSDQSAHPVHATPTAVSSAATPTQAMVQTPSTAVASPAEPLPTAPPATSAPHFAAGPTVEMMVRPTPAEPGPFRLPRWLERMLHPKDGPN